jgi:hypothetical protein
MYPSPFFLRHSVRPQRLEASEGKGYRYELDFYGREEFLKDWVLYEDKNKTFTNGWRITDKAQAVLDIIIQNINKSDPYSWTSRWEGRITEHDGKPDIDMEAMRSFEFNGTTAWEALDEFAKAWDCEWWVEETYDAPILLFIGKCFQQNKYGDILLDYTLVNKIAGKPSSEDYCTRLIPFGSTRNIPDNYRSKDYTFIQKRLRLPEVDPDSGKPIPGYIDAYEDMEAFDVVEQVHEFKDIFPRVELKVTEVTEVSRPIDDGKDTFTAYRISWETKAGKPFIFNSKWVLSGIELRVVFNTGKLAGMDFGAMFNPDGKDEASKEGQVIEIVRNENYGAPVPNLNMKPVVDDENPDEFVLYGWDASKITDSGLIEAAEVELLKRARAYLKEVSADTSVYSCEMNPVASFKYRNPLQTKDGGLLLKMGDKVILKDAALFPNEPDNERVSRIRGYERDLGFPYRCTYQCGDNPMLSRLRDMNKNISDLQYREYTSVNYNNVDESDLHTEDKWKDVYAALAGAATLSVYNSDIEGVLSQKSAYVYTGKVKLPNATIGQGKGVTAELVSLRQFAQKDVLSVVIGYEGTAAGYRHYYSVLTYREGWITEVVNASEGKHSVGGFIHFIALIENSGTNPPATGFTLTLAHVEGISSVSGGGIYNGGTLIPVTCEVMEDYIFAGWIDVAGTVISTATSFPYTMPNADVTLTAMATYTPTPRTLTLIQGVGIATLSGGGTYANGDEIQLLATIEDSHVFDGWYRYRQRLSSVEDWVYTMPADDVTLEARALPFIQGGIPATQELKIVAANVVPVTDNTTTLGSSSRGWKAIWVGIVNGASAVISGALQAASATISGALSAESATVSGDVSVSGNLTENGRRVMTQLTTNGSGNVVADISYSNGVLTETRGQLNPGISSIGYSTSGSGNVVTNVTASGSTVYVTKGTLAEDPAIRDIMRRLETLEAENKRLRK